MVVVRLGAGDALREEEGGTSVFLQDEDADLEEHEEGDEEDLGARLDVEDVLWAAEEI